VPRRTVNLTFSFQQMRNFRLDNVRGSGLEEADYYILRTYLAVSFARMAAFRSFLILDRRGEAGASVDVDDHRRLGAASLRRHREHACLVGE
jgi:hypothetical protein